MPIALDLRKAFRDARDGTIPDLAEPFDKRGAQDDEDLAAARDDLVAVIEEVITRAFRPAYLLSAAFAAAAVALAALFRRRIVA